MGKYGPLHRGDSEAMTILIHALGANMGGAMRHLTNFLPELGKHDHYREYTVLVRRSFPDLPLPKNIHLVAIPDSRATGWPQRIWHDVFLLPVHLKHVKYEAIISLTNFGPIWSPVPHIFFQRNPTYYCSHYLNWVTGRLKYEMVMRRRLAVASMMHADLIVTPSNAMGEMIREMYPQISASRFHTLYHGFSREGLVTESLDRKLAENLNGRVGIKLLYPSHAAPHKGFDVLFDLLSDLKNKRRDFCLVATVAPEDVVGGVGRLDSRVDQLGLRENVVFAGRVPQRQIGALYSLCDLMLYPSLCESFGFSMIEAIGFGIPIVAADTAINREICGQGALYYPSLDPVAGAKAVLKALQPEVRAKLQEGAKLGLDSFDWSWQRYALEFISMIETIC